MSGPAPTGLPDVPRNVHTGAQLVGKLALQAELAKLAMMIALEAPERFSKVGYTTVVNRSTVTRIREVLDQLGVDWKFQHRKIRSK